MEGVGEDPNVYTSQISQMTKYLSKRVNTLAKYYKNYNTSPLIIVLPQSVLHTVTRIRLVLSINVFINLLIIAPIIYLI